MNTPGKWSLTNFPCCYLSYQLKGTFTSSILEYFVFELRKTNMAAESHYVPQTKVDWTSNNAASQFRLWRKEVERIIDGPLASRSDRVKLNHI